ncbi:MAG: hypothetical protein LBE24_03230 [Methylobacillus sp.]|jgi:probable HAF family extracellular repeat protein|nr:hypothetical protein [Methylobacillus sp.]
MKISPALLLQYGHSLNHMYFLFVLFAAFIMAGAGNVWADDTEAQGELIKLEGLGGGAAISADGSTVVGVSRFDNDADTSPHAFRWTVDGGIQDLGHLGGYYYSAANGVSADGSVVVGDTSVAGYCCPHAFRWTISDGMQNLGTLGGRISRAWAVSADGNVVVGGSGIGNTAYSHAFRWTAKDGMRDLGTLGGKDSWATGVSADGGVVVGVSTTAGEIRHAFRWTAKDGMRDLGTLGEMDSYASAVSADGGVVVGWSSNFSGIHHAFRWTAKDGMKDLGTLGDAADSSEAHAVSTDGSVVVGRSHINRRSYAFRWTDTIKMQSITGWLTTTGITLPADIVLSYALSVCADGSVMVGDDANLWLVRIPSAARSAKSKGK